MGKIKTIIPDGPLLEIGIILTQNEDPEDKEARYRGLVQARDNSVGPKRKHYDYLIKTYFSDLEQLQGC
jgi:hypothetical protein